MQRRLHLLAPGDGAWQRPGLRELRDKPRVARAVHTSRLMVEMDNVQVKLGPMVMQKMQQGDAVSAAGDADGVAAGRHAVDGADELRAVHPLPIDRPRIRIVNEICDLRFAI